jgi:hypothetical protein
MINRLRLARNEQQANTESEPQILPSTPPAPKVRITIADGDRSYPPTTSNRNIRLLELKTFAEQLKTSSTLSGWECAMTEGAQCME